MKLISRNDIAVLAKEADRLPPDSKVIGLGFIKAADRVKVKCEICKRQYHGSSDLIDIDELLGGKLAPAKAYGAMLVISTEDVATLPFLTKFKCTSCGTKNVVENKNI